MEDNTLMDSEPVVEQEVQSTEPVDNSEENHGNDAWSEDFNMSDGPEQEVDNTEPEQESTEEAKPEYITEGLGKLDKPLVVKVKGKVYDLQDLDQIRDLVERGFVATTKMQELAEMKKELARQQNPDITDKELEDISITDEVENIAKRIAQSDYVEDFRGIVEQLPERVTEQLRTDPKLLDGLRIDVESGLANKIMPIASRYMDIDGMDFIPAYIKAGNEIMKSDKSRSKAVDKLTAVPKRTGNVEVKEKDIWNISDDEFRSLMASERR